MPRSKQRKKLKPASSSFQLASLEQILLQVKRSVGKLYCYTGHEEAVAIGTVFLIGPDWVATAAHNTLQDVIDPAKEDSLLPYDIAYAEFYGPDGPIRAEIVSPMYRNVKYVDRRVEHFNRTGGWDHVFDSDHFADQLSNLLALKEYDVTIFQIGKPIGDRLGWLPINSRYDKRTSIKAGPTMIAGFGRGDKLSDELSFRVSPFADSYIVNKSSGEGALIGLESCQVEGGDSGGPVFTYSSRHKRVEVMGVLTVTLSDTGLDLGGSGGGDMTAFATHPAHIRSLVKAIVPSDSSAHKGVVPKRLPGLIAG